MSEENLKSIWQKTKHWLADTGKQFGIAIFIVMFIRSSIIEPYKIPSGSMIPTLFIGDQIFVNKFAYGLKVPFTEFFMDRPISITAQQQPERGDVIVFRYPRDESVNYIKRVVGMPGDTIKIREKILYINEKPIMTVSLKSDDLADGIENDEDRYALSLFTEDLMGVKHPVLYAMKRLEKADYGPITVPEGKLFCMGDNRDKSADSREWGFVPLDNVKGKAMFVWLNFVLKFDPEFKFSLKPLRFATVIR